MSHELNEPDEFMDMKRTRQCCGLSAPTIYRCMKNGTFPKQVKIGSLSRWSKREILNWQAHRLETRGSAA